MELEKVYAVLDRMCAMRNQDKSVSKSRTYSDEYKTIGPKVITEDDMPIDFVGGPRSRQLEMADLFDLSKPITDLLEPVQTYIKNNFPSWRTASFGTGNSRRPANPFTRTLQEAGLKEELMAILRKRRAAVAAEQQQNEESLVQK